MKTPPLRDVLFYNFTHDYDHIVNLKIRFCALFRPRCKYFLFARFEVSHMIRFFKPNPFHLFDSIFFPSEGKCLALETSRSNKLYDKIRIELRCMCTKAQKLKIPHVVHVLSEKISRRSIIIIITSKLKQKHYDNISL